MINLRKLRTQRGLSQQALAEKFNLSQQSIYKYEHGLAEPDIETLKKLADYFNVSIDYLVGYSDWLSNDGCSSSVEISISEIDLIKKIRALRPEIRSSLISLIDHLLTHNTFSDLSGE